MDLRVQRLLGLFALCAAFGAAVWTLQVGDSKISTLLEHREVNRVAMSGMVRGSLAFEVVNTPSPPASAGSSGGESSSEAPKPNASGKGHHVCQQWRTDVEKAKAAGKTPPPAPACKMNITYGGGGIGTAQGKCVERKTSGDCDCSASNCPVQLSDNKGGNDTLSKAREALETNLGRPLSNQELQDLQSLLNDSGKVKTTQDVQALGERMNQYLDNVFSNMGSGPVPADKLLSELGPQYFAEPSAPTASNGSTFPPPMGIGLKDMVSSAAPAAAPSASSPLQQIGNIANSGSGYTPSGSGNAPGPSSGSAPQTFTPSPQLGSSPFNLGSLFGGGGPSGGGAGGYPGGTVAYAPQGDPGYYNRNFESVDAQITFPKAQPSPGDILARLAQNTKRTGEKVTIGGPEDGGIIDSFVRTILNNVVTPVGDFVRSAFSSEDTFQPSGGGTADASFVERQNLPPLERGRLVLTLSADDSLVPGDPTSIANIIEWEARESIPASNRAWVENAPRASDVIEDIGSAPLSYGWGEAPQIGGDAEVEAPQVSDVSYNPFLSPGGFIPEIGEDEGASEPPRSFFSVMAKSFGTIAEAVRSLFANIGKALFWWL